MTTIAASSSNDGLGLTTASNGGAIAIDQTASDVQAFKLGVEDCRPAQRLAGLDRIGERLARQLRTAVEPFLHAKTQVTAEPLELRRYEDWTAEQKPFLSLSLYRMRPLKGSMMVVLDAEFITGLVDTFYGGRGMPSTHKRAEFTASEDRMIGRMTEMLIGQLREAWAEVIKIEPVLSARETNPAYGTLARPQDNIILQRFTLEPAQGRSGSVTFLYPQSTLRPIEAELSVTVRDDTAPIDADWRRRLTYAVEDVRMPVRTVLARPELTMAQLMSLKPGDVIPINLAPKVPLLVAAKRFAEGTIGEQDGRAALLIESVGKGTEK